MLELSLVWLIAGGVGALVLGILVGHFQPFGKGGGKSRIRDLEDQLETAQTEMSDYRAEVYAQFSDTADKFKALDESYHALHRQLATSAVALCGEQGTPLLTNDNVAAERLVEAAPEAVETAGGEPEAESAQEVTPQEATASEPAPELDEATDTSDTQPSEPTAAVDESTPETQSEAIDIDSNEVELDAEKKSAEKPEEIELSEEDIQPVTLAVEEAEAELAAESTLEDQIVVEENDGASVASEEQKEAPESVPTLTDVSDKKTGTG